MKRTSILFLAVSLSGFLALTMLLGGSHLAHSAATATCAVPAGYATIGDAIADAGCDVIEIAAGTYPETLTVGRDLTLRNDGSGTVILDGQNSHRILKINGATTTVLLDTLILQYGNSGGDGGAIHNEGRLTLEDIFIESSVAASEGGAIYNSGALTMTNSTIFGAYAGGNGGCLYNSGMANLDEANVNECDADGGNGGAVYNIGSLEIDGGSFGAGWATHGGAIYSDGLGGDDSPTYVRDTVVMGYAETGSGGGIYSRLKPLHVTNSTIHYSQAGYQGGGIYATNAYITATQLTQNWANSGGSAIYIAPESATVGQATIVDSAIIANLQGSAVVGGHNIAATAAADLTLHNTTIADNGGLGLLTYGAATITLSTIHGNNGGGIWHSDSISSDNLLRMRQSTVSTNTVTTGGAPLGGGLRAESPARVARTTFFGNSAASRGGGIYSSAPLTLTNVTIHDNSAGADGGGLSHDVFDPTTLSLQNVTITNNEADSDGNDVGDGGGLSVASDSAVSATSVVLSANTDSSPTGNNYPDCDGGLDGATYSLISKAEGCSGIGSGSNQQGTIASPLLARLLALGDYGGATWTRRPRAVSPVLDAGACPNLARDQRGVSRPQDGDGSGGATCDVGAVERGSCGSLTDPALTLELLADEDLRLSWTEPAEAEGYLLLQANLPYDNSSAESYAIFQGSNHTAHNVLEAPLTATYFWLQAETACDDTGNWVRGGVFPFTLVAGS